MTVSDQNTQLARLWVALQDIQARVGNEVIPLGMRLELEDPELMQALEMLSERIRKHFERRRLVAEPRKRSTPEERSEA